MWVAAHFHFGKKAENSEKVFDVLFLGCIEPGGGSGEVSSKYLRMPAWQCLDS